jgi:hypothetical protein
VYAEMKVNVKDAVIALVRFIVSNYVFVVVVPIGVEWK